MSSSLFASPSSLRGPFGRKARRRGNWGETGRMRGDRASESLLFTAIARRWLRALERCVRAADYAAARPLFASDTYSFGTHAAVVRGRQALEREQWAHVWPRIRNFTFQLAQMRCLGNDAGLCVIVPWNSQGVGPDGRTFPRPGRTTVLLAPRRGRWVAIHSHFSLAPDVWGTGTRRESRRGARLPRQP